MKYTFPNGTTVEGTLDQIMAVAKALGLPVNLDILGAITPPRGYYNSESKGLLKISSMESIHIRNALLKRATSFFNGLSTKSVSTKSDRIAFLKSFTSLTTDSQIEDLFVVLSRK